MFQAGTNTAGSSLEHSPAVARCVPRITSAEPCVCCTRAGHQPWLECESSEAIAAVTARHTLGRAPMSLRPQAATPKASLHGSLFGPAIHAPPEGFWSRLAVSPPRSPPTAMLATPVPMPTEFTLDAPERADTDADVEMSDDSEVPVLDSVCPTWAYDLGDQVAMVLFDQEPSGTMTLRSSPRRVHNRNPVIAKTVAADGIQWKPMRDVGTTGAAGHVFQLTKGKTAVCRIEVSPTENGEGIRRVSIVQASYAPLAMASGIADRSSLLIYDLPDAHVGSLRTVHAGLGTDPELGYAPVSECCVTHYFDRLVLGMPLGVDYASNVQHRDARRIWDETKAFLKTMSTVTADCVDRYLETEMDRTGTHELRNDYRAWRRAVP